MPVISRVATFLKDLFRQRQQDQQLDEEISGYLEMLVDEKVRTGVAPAEARRQALLEMEGITQVKEKVRDVRSAAFFHSLLQDIRYGARLMMKRPAFTLFALLTLAIGIGTNTAIFSVVNSVLLEPLPYSDSNRLAIVWSVFKSAGLSRAPTSGPALAELRSRSRLFQDFGGIWVGSGALVGEGEPEQIKLGQVTSNFFSVLGVKPALGRLFLPEEEGGRSETVVLLSDGLWRRRFAADPRIVGQRVRMAAGTVTVAGVMPRDFELIFPADSSVPGNIQAWIPFPFPIEKGPRDLNFVRVIGRLQPGVTLPQAQAELDNIGQQLCAQFREYSEQDLNLQALPLHGDVVKEVRPALLALFAGVALVLLIACANVANLLLARASERTREMTMRRALGASLARMMRQMITESVMLAFLGGAAGLGVAWLLLKSIPALWPDAAPRLHTIGLDPRTLAFTSALCILTGLLFGMAPALGISRLHLVDALRGGKTAAPGRSRFRRLLVLGEVGLAFMLLIGAGLMIRTFVRLLQVDPGFNAANTLTFAVTLPGGRYHDDAKRNEFLRLLEHDLATIPGVESVGAVSHIPFDDFPNWYSYFWPVGADKEQQSTWMADHRSVSPGFFTGFGVPLVAGRPFSETDDIQHPRVAIVDERLAQQAWPGKSAIGQKVNVEVIVQGEFLRDWAEVVGVARHVKYQSLMQPGRPQVYLPSAQSPRPQMQMAFALRTGGPTENLTEPIKRAVTRLDKDLPVSKLRSLEAYVDVARTRTRFVTLLSGLLGAIALLLACIGIYGVTSYSVAQTTNEIGVRMALGAQQRDIVSMVLRRSMTVVAVGIILGGAASFLLTPLLGSLLFQVQAKDWLTFAVVAALLCLVGFLACLIPAGRASRVDPMVALRCE
jgi:predicted permease